MRQEEKDLLFKLYSIHSPSGNEKKMRKFLKRQATDLGAMVKQDAHGNLLVTKGEEPAGGYACLCAHMDQVQHQHSKDFKCVECNGIVSAWSKRAGMQQGLGADDKNGLWICLLALKRFSALKCAFFVEEEMGDVGSSKVDLSFFDNCRYIVEPDRKGAADLIVDMSCGRCCSQEFIDALGYKEFGYREACGTLTDVTELLERGFRNSVLNLSCGYHEPHTDHEFTVLSELENARDFVFHIVETLEGEFPFKLEPRTVTYNYDTYGWRSVYGNWLDKVEKDDGQYSFDSTYEMYYDDVYGVLSTYPEMSFGDVLAYIGEDTLSASDRAALEAVYDDAKYQVEFEQDEASVMGTK